MVRDPRISIDNPKPAATSVTDRKTAVGTIHNYLKDSEPAKSEKIYII